MVHPTTKKNQYNKNMVLWTITPTICCKKDDSKDEEIKKISQRQSPNQISYCYHHLQQKNIQSDKNQREQKNKEGHFKECIPSPPFLPPSFLKSLWFITYIQAEEKQKNLHECIINNYEAGLNLPQFFEKPKFFVFVSPIFFVVPLLVSPFKQQLILRWLS